MPLVKINIASKNELTLEEEKKIMHNLSRIISDSTGKSAQYIMACLNESAISMNSSEEPAAFVDIRGIGGLTPTMNKAISEKICSYLEREWSINPNRVYLTFIEVPASSWGWNGSTFG